jgi:hypothetical protein
VIVFDHEQGSKEWLDSRLGKATASCFNQIMTTKQLKRSKSDYVYLLAAEKLTGEEQTEQFSNAHTERGNYFENEAIPHYEFVSDLSVESVGFCQPHKKSAYGCSPDGLIGSDGGIEIKSPALKKHLQYLKEAKVPDEYLHQVYGCLFVTGRDWWDFMSYHKDCKELIVRVTSDDDGYKKWAKAFDPILSDFLQERDEVIKLAEME